MKLKPDEPIKLGHMPQESFLTDMQPYTVPDDVPLPPEQEAWFMNTGEPPFKHCPVCGSAEVVRLARGWDEGKNIAIIGCGNQWHYIVPEARSLDDEPLPEEQPDASKRFTDRLVATGSMESCTDLWHATRDDGQRYCPTCGSPYRDIPALVHTDRFTPVYEGVKAALQGMRRGPLARAVLGDEAEADPGWPPQDS